MSAFLDNLLNNILITMESLINSNRHFLCFVFGFECFEMWFLTRILPGQKAALAYCGREAGNSFLLLPLRIDERGVKIHVR